MDDLRAHKLSAKRADAADDASALTLMLAYAEGLQVLLIAS